MQRYRPAVHVPQPSLFHSLIFWHSSQYLPRCNAAVNYRCRAVDERCKGRRKEWEGWRAAGLRRSNWTLVLLNLRYDCNESANMDQRANHPNTTKGTCAAGEYANQGCVPKIRAHNLEDISCSTLMVIGESVSSDCCLKDESQQSFSVYLKSESIFLFSFWFGIPIVNWHLTWRTTSKCWKHNAVR